jgi:hypothetical protein
MSEGVYDFGENIYDLRLGEIYKNTWLVEVEGFAKKTWKGYYSWELRVIADLS